MTFIPADAAGGISTEARALETLGMLVGDGKGVTEEYTQKEMTRLTAAISILKLRGLYEEALDYKGPVNFVDKDEIKWAEGKNILAYLKVNPSLGFIGDEEGRFGPYKSINEQSYYKVLLETLGYSQSGVGIKGDFSWNDTLKFAASIGLKPTTEYRFTIDLLSKATVSALKTQTKAGKIYINVLIDTGKIRKSSALAAGLIWDTIDAEIKSVKAVGNTIVEVVFYKNISGYDVEALDQYSIEGLTIKSVDLVREDAIRFVTSSQSSGKLYTLRSGDAKLKFTGVAKVSGSPRIKSVKSEDIETVVIEFDKELDLYAAVDISNYTISGVEIEKAELEGKKVTLSTYGLLGKKQYTIKVMNIKSVDGVVLRSESKSFYTRLDTTPPSLKDVKAETNQRVVVKFSEPITRASAEELGNYLIKSNSEELDVLEAKLVGEEEDTVELTTEPQRVSAKYEITIENIADKTKAANVMKRAAKKNFYGMRIDTTAPQLSKNDLKVLSRNYIQVVFSDSSRLNEDTVLDTANYTVNKNDRYKEEIYVEGVEKISYADGKYKVILRVEDLSLSSSYTVTVYNIEDEFGNVMEKNNSGSVTVATDDFAAATVKDYKVVGGNKIDIYFTKPLNEESAEDISNYEINNSIGAPVGATYKDEKVTLEAATMVEGKVYKLAIDGVMDRTGNRLKLTFEFRAIAGENDFEGPHLDYVYAVNKYVVAAAFDEPVTYTAGTTALVLKSGNQTMKLYAKALTDDDRTIEFSNVGENKTLSDYGVYTIVKDESLKGINDRTVNKNAFDRSDLWDYDLEVYGNGESPEVPEILYITQRDGKTFEMEMSKEIVVKNKEAVAIGSTATFDVKREGDNKNIVTFTISSSKYIDGTKEYKIDIRKVLTDNHGIEAENTYGNYTMLYGEYKDEDKPYIVTVTALDRLTVEIEYSENIGYEGKYTIKNTDDYAKYKTIPNSLKKIDRNRVILSLSQPLEGRYEYRLIIDSQAKDMVANVSEDLKGDEFYFAGTDLAPVKVPEIQDQAIADIVSNKIAALPQVVKLTDKEVIGDTTSKYNALTTKQKQLVTNYSKLAAAQQEVQRLEAAHKKAEEEKQRQEAERKRIEAEQKKQAEEKKRLEEEHRKQEEEKKQLEEQRKQEEKKQLEEQQRKAEEERIRLEEEQRKAEEESVKAAEAAVQAFELAVGEKALGAKVIVLSNRVADLKELLSVYIDPPIALEKRPAVDESILMANAATVQADAEILAAKGLKGTAFESIDKLKVRDVKTALEERATSASSKMEKAAETIKGLKDEIAKVKDRLDVEDAKAWLTVDKLVFAPIYTASHKEPRILAITPHANGTIFEYAEFGSASEDKSLENKSRKRDNIAFLEIVKKTGNVKITRGEEDVSIMLKVKITKGNVMTEKLFKVNIPGLSNKGSFKYQPVTIEVTEEPPAIRLTPLVPLQPIEVIVPQRSTEY